MDKLAKQDQLEMKMKQLLAKVLDVQKENLKYKKQLIDETNAKEEQVENKIKQLEKKLDDLIKTKTDEIKESEKIIKSYDKKKVEIEEKFNKLINIKDAEWKQASFNFDNLLDSVEGAKETILKRIKSQLAEIDAKLELWNEMVKKASGNIKTEMKKNITLLNKKREQLQSKIDEAEKIEEEENAWENIQDGLFDASKILNEKFSKAIHLFKGRNRRL